MGPTVNVKKRTALTIHQVATGDSVILGTANIVIKGKENLEVRTRALCDNGSQVNLITTTIVQQLRETPNSERTSFVGVGGSKLGSSVGEIKLRIKLNDGRCMVTNFFVVKNITNYSPRTNKRWTQLQGKLADENYYKPGKIHALLGVGSWIQIIQPEVLRSADGQSIAHKTKLGYVILEDTADPYQIEQPYIGAVTRGPSIRKLMDIVQRLWEVEEVPQLNKRTKEEQICEDVFKNQHLRDKTGRYVVRIPFNDKIHKLGKSKRMALHQFFAMENKMKKNREFAEKYKLFMSEYETLGHMKQVWEISESGYYTPHHGIMSANKFRVVFNASAKTSTGVTLNETQLVGEKLQRDLVEILMNFRQFKFGITADIEKMYRQIWIHEDDQQYQKILWRDNDKEPIKVFQLKTVTYGHACAPHSAIRTLMQCAYDHKNQYPRAAGMIKECFYVDDLLTGANNETEVDAIKEELISILKLGGFNITKWKTNGKFKEHIEFPEGEEQSVLGLCWNLSTDKFFYKLRSNDDNEKSWTKRKILSKIGKMYDPNGYLGPVIIKGKMIIQNLWRDNLDWDEEIKGELKTDWEDFNEDLNNVKLISVNRWLGTKGQEVIQIHGFCDASEKGYGAVVYSRVREGESYRTELIASKSKVAPLRVITIPRLELCAATLLTKLLKTVIPLFKGKEGRSTKTHCWSDSQIVLQWLTKPSANLKTYVANRVANIQTFTEDYDVQWNWIKGEDNPADLISRGTTMKDLSQEKKWWKGPDWLYLLEKEWPRQPDFREQSILSEKTMEELLKETKPSTRAIHHISRNTNELMRGNWFKFPKEAQQPVPLLDAYGDWKKLLRVTSAVLKATVKFKVLRKGENQEPINNAEITATNYLIQRDQERSFPKEIEAAKENNREVLAKLVLIWDNELQILRIDGRVRSNNLTRDEQFPILLDKEGALAPLLIRDAHLKNNGHGATQWILQYLRKKYWIMGARRLTKGIVSKCPVCFKLRMKGSDQLMANLPIYRTTPNKPFYRTGVDYAGPVTLRSALGRLPKLTKAWIAVFVCLITRAIHLELVTEASTAAFIAALRRMIGRRGEVKDVISDNGTNFVGANNYLTAIYNQLNHESREIEAECSIKWKFTTPGAPHQGGIYEAAVKSVKYHLTRIIGETTLTYEEYSTVLCQVEAMVNSRPLSPLNDDATSLNALTPGHFLIGEALVRIPDEGDFRETPINRLSRWNHLQKMTQHFWERWHTEYLNGMINRSKWPFQKRNFKIGDLVVIREDNLPPTKWKLARIQEVLPGPDNLVRSVVVRTNVGVFKRPITKLGLFIETKD